ncbi:hypothetical protein JHK82_017840 [Glycine max]|nr:hypothetical protein JHK82_017840 [Glycine max]KHN04611.1 hypothetical protein glysoja_021910 [Glycine soja]
MFQFTGLSLACPWIQHQFERLTYIGNLRIYASGVSNLICSPSFRLSVSVSAQQSAFAVGVLSNLYAFHRSTRNSLTEKTCWACDISSTDRVAKEMRRG